VVAMALTVDWSPLGPEAGTLGNAAFVFALLALCLGTFWLFERAYPRLLRWCLDHKALFLLAPAALVAFGSTAWLGLGRILGALPEGAREAGPVAWLAEAFPGFGREFLPPFDEGSFLYMPTTMPHAS